MTEKQKKERKKEMVQNEKTEPAPIASYIIDTSPLRIILTRFQAICEYLKPTQWIVL